jgi:hydroxymethylpyrimidine pyrophosphatase-like HAD family hydrolase
MKHDIIKTDNYLLIVSDEEITIGEYYAHNQKPTGIRILICENYTLPIDAKKIISHLPLNNSPILEGVDLLPPLEDEVKKLADALGFYDSTEDNKGNRTTKAFIAGYNKAKEKYKYTEEDLRIAIQQAFLSGVERLEDFGKVESMLMENIQQPKYPIGFKCEMETPYTDAYAEDRMRRFYGKPKPKTTTNSQGQKVWVGTYVYAKDGLNAREYNSPIIQELIDETTQEEFEKIDKQMSNNFGAVDWLVEQLNGYSHSIGMPLGTNLRIDISKETIEKAKEMEKQQKNNMPIHIHEGISNTWVYIEDGVVHVKPNNETYGGNK